MCRILNSLVIFTFQYDVMYIKTFLMLDAFRFFGMSGNFVRKKLNGIDNVPLLKTTNVGMQV